MIEILTTKDQILSFLSASRNEHPQISHKILYKLSPLANEKIFTKINSFVDDQHNESISKIIWDDQHIVYINLNKANAIAQQKLQDDLRRTYEYVMNTCLISWIKKDYLLEITPLNQSHRDPVEDQNQFTALKN